MKGQKNYHRKKEEADKGQRFMWKHEPFFMSKKTKREKENVHQADVYHSVCGTEYVLNVSSNESDVSDRND